VGCETDHLRDAWPSGVVPLHAVAVPMLVWQPEADRRMGAGLHSGEVPQVAGPFAAEGARTGEEWGQPEPRHTAMALAVPRLGRTAAGEQVHIAAVLPGRVHICCLEAHRREGGYTAMPSGGRSAGSKETSSQQPEVVARRGCLWSLKTPRMACSGVADRQGMPGCAGEVQIPWAAAGVVWARFAGTDQLAGATAHRVDHGTAP